MGTEDEVRHEALRERVDEQAVQLARQDERLKALERTNLEQWLTRVGATGGGLSVVGVTLSQLFGG